MNFKSRLTIAIATGAVLVNALAPFASADTLTVSGNGASSNNSVAVSSNSTTAVNQTNNANITNNVDSNASTGGNSSNFNTGGNTTIKTGDANSTVSVSNAANLNEANVSCGCSGGATNVTVSGNGAYSDNGVAVENANNVFLNQTNNANFNNDVDAKASTGKNDSSYNTGGSSVIMTGDAATHVSVDNKANANFANVGGNGGNAGGSSITISGNGAHSGNEVALEQNSAVVLDQSNDAYIKNDVDAKAKTGDNSEQFNTGGNNGVKTGDATTNVSVGNEANFNAADVNCDCVLNDLTAKIAGNGDDSWNAIAADVNNSLFPDQVNDAGLFNDVDGSSKTGDNSVGFSTGSVWGDPAVFTGDGTSTTGVNNAGNVNLLNDGHSFTLPGNWDLGVNFDLNGLMSFLGAMV